MSLLEISNLSVEFGPAGRAFKAVDGVGITLDRGEVLGIVGESGSGKSVTMMALMGLLEGQGRVSADVMRFDECNLLTASAAKKRSLLGKDMAMIFQDPMTSLNPCFTVGDQITEVLHTHTKLRGGAAKKRALELMDLVEIPDAKSRLNNYPHQFSGGMSQRVMIAIAIACKPKLLIADEPTTALDVTIQAQIMDLLLNLQKSNGMALLMITHDLAVVAQVAKRVAVMYAGQVVEEGLVGDLFKAPAHPYTDALLRAVPERSRGAHRLSTLAGMVPGQYDRPKGCLLAPRCQYAQAQCAQETPEMVRTQTSDVRCFFPLTHEVRA